MATLPEGWEFDYDGSRWFYRYKPSGLTQFNFPKAGDEFPEFVGALAGGPSLPPEEKLESQQQVKRRSTATTASGNGFGAAQAKKQGPGTASAARVPDPDDGGVPWFQPDSFMYLGPGSYNDVSPLHEEDEVEPVLVSRTVEGSEEGAGGPEAGVAVADARPAYVSPVVSVAATTDVSEGPPAAFVSVPATAEPIIGEQLTARAIPPETAVASSAPGFDAATGPAHFILQGAATSPGVPLLDSRPMPVQQTFSPVGFMAELESDITVRCREERHPAPVELPSYDMMMMAESLPTMPQTINYDVFQMEPAELPTTLATPVGGHITNTLAEQKSLGQCHENAVAQAYDHQPSQQQQYYQQQPPVHPQQPPQQHSHPEAGPSQPVVDGSDNLFRITRKPTAAGTKPSKYHAFTPGEYIAGDDNKRSSLVLNGYSIAQSQDMELQMANKRHSFAGLLSSKIDPSDVPAVLQPPQVPHQPFNYGVHGGQLPESINQAHHPRPLIPGSAARHDSISIPPEQQHTAAGQAHPSGLFHVPSVLKPALGRQAGVQPQPAAPVLQQPPSSQVYAAYHPPQSVVGNPVPAASQRPQATVSRPFQETQPPRQSVGSLGPVTGRQPTARPHGLVRTNTLPADMPSLPFMGAHPSMAGRSSTSPAVHQAPPIHAFQPTVPSAEESLSDNSTIHQTPATTHTQQPQVQQTALQPSIGEVSEGSSFLHLEGAPAPLRLGQKVSGQNAQSSDAGLTGSIEPLYQANSNQYPQPQAGADPIAAANSGNPNAMDAVALTQAPSLSDERVPSPVAGSGPGGPAEPQSDPATTPPPAQTSPPPDNASEDSMKPTTQSSPLAHAQAQSLPEEPPTQLFEIINTVNLTVQTAPSSSSVIGPGVQFEQNRLSEAKQASPPGHCETHGSGQTPSTSNPPTETQVGDLPLSGTTPGTLLSAQPATGPQSPAQQPSLLSQGLQQPVGFHPNPPQHPSFANSPQIQAFSVSGGPLPANTHPLAPQGSCTYPASSTHRLSMSSVTSGVQERPTPPPGDGPTSPPSQVVQGQSPHMAHGSPASPAASFHRLSMSSTGFRPTQGTPPPGAAGARPSPPQSIHSNSPQLSHGSPASAHVAAHRISLSGAPPGFHVSGHPTPPLGHGPTSAPGNAPQGAEFHGQSSAIQRPPSVSGPPGGIPATSTTQQQSPAQQSPAQLNHSQATSLHGSPHSLHGKIGSPAQVQTSVQQPPSLPKPPPGEVGMVSHQPPIHPSGPQPTTYGPGDMVPGPMPNPGPIETLPIRPGPPGHILVKPQQYVPPHGDVPAPGPLLGIQRPSTVPPIANSGQPVRIHTTGQVTPPTPTVEGGIVQPVTESVALSDPKLGAALPGPPMPGSPISGLQLAEQKPPQSLVPANQCQSSSPIQAQEQAPVMTGQPPILAQGPHPTGQTIQGQPQGMSSVHLLQGQIPPPGHSQPGKPLALGQGLPSQPHHMQSSQFPNQPGLSQPGKPNVQSAPVLGSQPGTASPGPQPPQFQVTEQPSMQQPGKPSVGPQYMHTAQQPGPILTSGHPVQFQNPAQPGQQPGGQPQPSGVMNNIGTAAPPQTQAQTHNQVPPPPTLGAPVATALPTQGPAIFTSPMQGNQQTPGGQPQHVQPQQYVVSSQPGGQQQNNVPQFTPQTSGLQHQQIQPQQSGAMALPSVLHQGGVPQQAMAGFQPGAVQIPQGPAQPPSMSDINQSPVFQQQTIVNQFTVQTNQQTTGTQSMQSPSSASSSIGPGNKKNWFDKASSFWKNDAFRKTGFAVGSAVESLGSAGAAIGSGISDTTRPSNNPQTATPPGQQQWQQRPPSQQAQPKPQAQPGQQPQAQQQPQIQPGQPGPQRPPAVPQTAPPQVQGLPRPNGQVAPVQVQNPGGSGYPGMPAQSGQQMHPQQATAGPGPGQAGQAVHVHVHQTQLQQGQWSQPLQQKPYHQQPQQQQQQQQQPQRPPQQQQRPPLQPPPQQQGQQQQQPYVDLGVAIVSGILQSQRPNNPGPPAPGFLPYVSGPVLAQPQWIAQPDPEQQHNNMQPAEQENTTINIQTSEQYVVQFDSQEQQSSGLSDPQGDTTIIMVGDGPVYETTYTDVNVDMNVNANVDMDLTTQTDVYASGMGDNVYVSADTTGILTADGTPYAETSYLDESGYVDAATTAQTFADEIVSAGLSNAGDYIYTESSYVDFATTEQTFSGDGIVSGGFSNAESYLYADSGYDGSGWGDGFNEY